MLIINSQFGENIQVDADDRLSSLVANYFFGKTDEQSSTQYQVTIATRRDSEELRLEGAKLEPFYDDHEVLSRADHGRDQAELLIDRHLQIRVQDRQINISLGRSNEFSERMVLHTIRALVDKIAFDARYVLLHAGAFALGEATVGVIGDKGAGKTTTIVQALDRHGAGYISNDRVFAKVIGDKLHVIERESETKLGEETIRNSRLAPLLEQQRLDGGSGKYLFNQLYHFFDAKRVVTGKISHLLEPHIKSATTSAQEKPFLPGTLDQHIITDCLGFNLLKTLYGNRVHTILTNSNKLHPKVIEAHGPQGIEEALCNLSSSTA